MPRLDVDRDAFLRTVNRRRRWAYRRDRLESLLGHRPNRRPLQARVYDAAFRTDAEAVSYFYALRNDHLPDFQRPLWINEKIRWQFLHHPNPLMSLAADKIGLRDYLAWKGAEVPAPAILATGRTSADFLDRSLPQRFVLKSAFGSGQNHIHTGETPPDRAALAARIDAWSAWDQWRRTGELHYRDIPKRWLVEDFVPATGEKLEFKFFCLHGEPAFVTVITERNGTSYRRAVYDLDWTRLEVIAGGVAEVETAEVPRPRDLDRMVAEARRLSEDFLHVRVDFLKFDGQLFVSELTFATLGAAEPFRPYALNRELGERIDLSRATGCLERGRQIALRLGWRPQQAGPEAPAGRRKEARLNQIYGWLHA